MIVNHIFRHIHFLNTTRPAFRGLMGLVGGHKTRAPRAHCSAVSGCLGEFAPNSWMNHLLLFFHFLVIFSPLLFCPLLYFSFFFSSADNFTEATGLGKDDREAQCVYRLMHHICLLSSNTEQQYRPPTLQSTHVPFHTPVDFFSLPQLMEGPFDCPKAFLFLCNHGKHIGTQSSTRFKWTSKCFRKKIVTSVCLHDRTKRRQIDLQYN